MKLEHQVCSLELAKRLKELGVKQESLFYWVKMRQGLVLKTSLGKKRGLEYALTQISGISAFTVAELGEMLPAYILGDEGMRFDLNVWKDAGWNAAYWWDEDTRRSSGMAIQTSCEATEADARAKMLIYLLENHLIPVP